MTKKQLKEFDEYREEMEGCIYAPHSINHGYKIHDPQRLPFATETLLKIEIARLTDFIDFLFSDKEYCDHANESEAWDEFEQWEYRQILLSKDLNVKGSDTTGA